MISNSLRQRGRANPAVIHGGKKKTKNVAAYMNLRINLDVLTKFRRIEGVMIFPKNLASRETELRVPKPRLNVRSLGYSSSASARF